MEQLWDKLRRKYVAATPEEKVRQWFIAQLQESFKVPVHMMMSEVGFKFGQKQYRADIVVYDRSASPLAVVECKKPEVAIDAAVAEQAMRYNIVLNVSYLILTNGCNTYIYRRSGDIFVPCTAVPTYEEMLCGR